MVLSLFPELSTNRIVADDVNIFFQYEGLVAALAVSYCRFTIKTPYEPYHVRLALAAFLGYLAFMRYEYWFLTSAHACSYGQLIYTYFCNRIIAKDHSSTVKSVPNPYKETKGPTLRVVKQYAFLILAVLSAQLAIIHIIYSCFQPHATHSFFQNRIYQRILHPYIISTETFCYLTSKFYENISILIPLTEVLDAYNILIEFVDPQILHVQMKHLLYVTVHVQVGMGFLGIGFLTREQERKNILIRLEDKIPQLKNKRSGNDESVDNSNNRGVPIPKANTSTENMESINKKFTRGATSFIIFSALPYMFQIIFYGGVNMYAYHCFRDDIHRTIRLRGLFDLDGGRFVATATVEANYRSPGEYATNVETVISTVYNMVNGKLFSVPKLLLLPQIIAKQPMLLVKIFPFILMSDYIKSTIVSKVTSEVERINKKTQEVSIACT